MSFALIHVLMSVAVAAGPNLGIVTAKGPFRINGSTVSGNATLLDGAIVETTGVPSRLALTGGARVLLSKDARAQVYRDRLVLEKGFGDLTGAYSVEARSLRIAPATANASGRIALAGDKGVQVAAAKGTFRVFAASGILVSNVGPGVALDFEPQVQGPTAPSTFVGCLLKKDGKFILYDQTTSMIVELRGSGFEREWGNRVQANGTAAAAAQPRTPNVQVLDVTSVVRLETGGCDGVARAVDAQVPPPPAAPKPAVITQEPPPPAPKTGMSAGTKVAIAVAVIGGGGGAAAAVIRSRSK